MKESLTKKERLGKKKDLNKIFAFGKSYKYRGAKILFLKNSLSFSRFAVILVRKFGTSVERNYAKRIFKEFFRKEKNKINPYYDVIYVLYPGDYKYEDRLNQFNYLMRKAKIAENS